MKKLNKIFLGLFLANLAFLNSNAMKRGAGEITGSEELDQRAVKARLIINSAQSDNRKVVPIDDIGSLIGFIQGREIRGTKIFVGTLDIQKFNKVIRLKKFASEGPFDERSVNVALTKAAKYGSAKVVRALFSSERIIGLIKNYLTDPDTLDEDDFINTNYGANAAFRLAAINNHCKALQTIIDNQEIFGLIDEFTVNDVLADVLGGGQISIDIIRILLGDKMKDLINQDGVNEALRIAERVSRERFDLREKMDEIIDILNAYKNENF